MKITEWLRPLAVLAAAMTLVRADGPTLPPQELRAEWPALEQLQFADWSIHRFLGWDTPFDGGSRVFAFETTGGERFELVVAHPNYWTPDDRRARRQVFFVRHRNLFYRVDPGSPQEQNLIAKLTAAAGRLSGTGNSDPQLLPALAARLASRQPVFQTDD